ncbi:hypothetical protein RGU70_11525 [Herbaspirillum sp. RTI4]|uniref:hypothetical protein n=1 Tax=Herbaspirillum sp. RTI4 TaxID=3048640 RepID=UPI002AB4D683|nr:hypothetical protein [Herbaspirillum sp. RTI4]MDY7578951.1 hypothetical protein [Herbaspirillum sp. RTI4]MEA9980882.1 hypothetical protein [Herbaspirillum sp. RTI4]
MLLIAAGTCDEMAFYERTVVHIALFLLPLSLKEVLLYDNNTLLQAFDVDQFLFVYRKYTALQH